MARIPVITGYGGINTAGRSSFNHGYRRLILDALSQDKADQTYRSLASLMKLEFEGTEQQKQFIRDHTLIRKIEDERFQVDGIRINKRMPVSVSGDDSASFITKARNLPQHIPDNWQVTAIEDKMVKVDIQGETEFMFPTKRGITVQAAGQLPSGFDPGSLYPARSHPRGLQMAVYGASDAVQSMGIDWDVVCQHVSPDQISVYAGSAMGQLDQHGHGGMLGARYNDKRTTSKHCPFGLAEMSADFINAYVLGSMGNTGTYVGACASFLYNLRAAVSDIKNGVARVVVIGSSEAPVESDVMEGYAAMGALATDQALLELDAKLGLNSPDHRRAARPFSSNCGFTIAESSQYIVLMDDELAMELGATIHGAVTDVFVNADGHKKSISSPGVGNYITMAKAVASARALLGDESVRQRSFVQAHGTSTPQNRVSESHILNETAKVFGIENWPVAAIKAYVGHSLGSSPGDQIMATLGVWNDGIIPGIGTIDHVAEDVYQSNLQLGSAHIDVGPRNIDSAILNAKGFGGNNASATVIAPHIVETMLSNKYGEEAMTAYKTRNEAALEQAAAYDESAMKGDALPIYKFDHNVLGGEDIDFSSSKIKVPGYEFDIELDVTSPYAELL
ncbi:beta-ketoacyl synthase [Oceanicoccus sagamiensis]|uniref:Beta-ketoacyl synthase n=1 Tax=Oceanicoccus sagamiensis TaxID=716816 RepID=A0A1X9NFW8_9GAMM|nr:beta-ketoacyl synthase [Oceanicoccus sagamiensis]ARN76071.1 beta-ketoacyl synthase [Oceanicoccus sagamiensis]